MPTPFQLAADQYQSLGVNVESALAALAQIQISLHCWQGDDVTGFENPEGLSGGGIQATGNYPGKARNPDELRQDIDQALALIPGTHRLNLHALYAETGGKKVDRDQLAPEHFARWIDWAKSNHLGLDFNPSYFSHPLAADGFTLSSSDKPTRDFWIRHGIASRKIAEAMGKSLGNTCITNFWIPDGHKDTPADRLSPRLRLKDSLDQIFAAPVNPQHNKDALEGKLFGLGLESYTVGSHEFYLAYAALHKKLLCLDAGHYHPTESLADKISAVLVHLDEILLHVSRPVRWDSDHVVTLTDDLRDIATEIIRGRKHNFLNRIHLGLDFFDASINRVAAWIIGARNMQKALLLALLEPTEKLQQMELAGDHTSRLALMEETKMLPASAIWQEFCTRANLPPGPEWLNTIQHYEHTVQSNRQ